MEMGNVNRVEDRTFRVNFTGDGVGRLRERVNDKLKEFMGDYTDDTLVEYVIVLLRNGRRKEEARNELNVFLGDDSDSFVSWLWDHLASNLDLYVHPHEIYTDDMAKTKSIVGDKSGRNESHHMHSESERLKSDNEKVKSDNLSRSRRKREWKGLVRDAAEPPPLRSSEVESIRLEEKKHHKVSHAGRSPSPRPSQQKKRSWHDERQHSKREASSQATIDAPRRLLQFAVRDAVGTLRPSVSVKEPPPKRLRSVVSTSTEQTSLVDHPRRLQSIARIPNTMATVMKAVQEAAEDVIKVKSTGSVFDRLGRDAEISDTAEEIAEFRDAGIEDEYEEFNQVQQQTYSNYIQRSDYSAHAGNTSMMECETRLGSDSLSDNEGYNDVNVMGRRVMDVSQTGTSGGNKGEDSLNVQYSLAKDQEQPVSTAKTSRKIVNISVSVNTWKPPRFQQSQDAAEMDNQISVQENKVDTGKFGVQLMKENSNPVSVRNGNANRAPDILKEPLKSLPSVPGSYTAGRPWEDADSRTIFVSNVHFGATKDSLSRHFNKFGEVLKVVIVTDVATGQPKGSAYVEFMRKDAADNALSLDGTSFMSRILKVMKRSSSQQEATPMVTWPRIARGSPYAPARFGRAPFTRGIPGGFRARLPVKPGARSLQWKRDAQTTPAESSATASGNSVISPTARSLTYIRPQAKPDGNSGTT